MKATRILILEDDLETLSVLLLKLSEYTQVEKYLNKDQNLDDFSVKVISQVKELL